jgi:hypothetical protein
MWQMTTDARPSGLLLPLVILGLAVLLVGGAAVAAFCPLEPCPQRNDHGADVIPCFNCDGFGWSTLFQKWNYRRWYEQQLREVSKIKM